jgi:hypothetical protein
VEIGQHDLVDEPGDVEDEPPGLSDPLRTADVLDQQIVRERCDEERADETEREMEEIVVTRKQQPEPEQDDEDRQRSNVAVRRS